MQIKANKLVPLRIQNISMERCNLRRVFSNFNDERVEEDDGLANFNNETFKSTNTIEELFRERKKERTNGYCSAIVVTWCQLC